jgi:hypothetical protein
MLLLSAGTLTALPQFQQLSLILIQTSCTSRAEWLIPHWQEQHTLNGKQPSTPKAQLVV